MKRILLSLLPLLLVSSLSAQQLPDRSIFQELAYTWNPAMTAPFSAWSAGASYRQQWVGFNDAPRTIMLHGQYHIEDFNTSIGGFVRSDKINPLTSNQLAFTYAYRIEVGRGGQFSIGAGASITQYFLDATAIVVTQPDDDLLPAGENTVFKPNFDVGVFYVSDIRDPFRDNYFFMGLGAQQLLGSSLIFDEFGGPANLKRELHGNAVVGARFNGNSGFLEPSAWANYSQPGILEVNLSLKFEQYDTFWAGIAYNSGNTLAVQLGYILSEGFVGDGAMRVGTLGTYNIGAFGPFRGLGYEFFLAYDFEL